MNPSKSTAVHDPSDAPDSVSIRCSVLDYEAVRDRMEANGYAIVNCETNGKLATVHGTRKACNCDLCRTKQQQNP
jgi:hypothetical protein